MFIHRFAGVSNRGSLRFSRLLPVLALAALAGCESATDVTSLDEPRFAVNGSGAGPDSYLVFADGLPDLEAALHGQWSSVSGPGAVEFADPFESLTTATFSAAGSYLLRWTPDSGASIDNPLIVTDPPNTILVPQDHPTIQAAIDAAQTGDMVLVSPGTYVEGLVVEKTITLASTFYTTGDEALIGQTVIQSTSLDVNVITVGHGAGPGTRIVGFTMTAGLDGIKIQGEAAILNNHFTGVYNDAVDFDVHARGLVMNNLMENNGDDGVDIDHAVTLVRGNVMRNSNGDGIEMRIRNETSPVFMIVIRDNVMSGNEDDGIQLMDQDATIATNSLLVIARNKIVNNLQAGLGLMDNGITNEDFRAASLLERIHLFNNTFVGNAYGVTGGDNLVALNNLFVGHPNSAVKNVDGGSVLSHNLFWNNGTDNDGSNLDVGTTLFADPVLDPDHFLQPTSPAIDAGTALFTLASGQVALDYSPDQYFGGAPDLGWLETTISTSCSAGNDPPSVNAGSNQAIFLPTVMVGLNGVVSDDGNPDPPGVTTIEWTQVSGPPGVTFADASDPQTTATFPGEGTFALRLMADDSECSTADDVVVTVVDNTAGSVNVRVGSGSDDAEESPTGGMSLTSSDLELVADRGGDQTVGMRFTGVDVPVGATITSAWVQFQVDEVNTVPTDLTVQGEVSPNPVTFTGTNGDITSRPWTSAAVAWSPPEWSTSGAAGPDQRTPDIKGVIQEIVDQPGWAQGNPMVVIITGTGERTAEAYEGVPSAAPLLHVDYSMEPQENTAPTATAVSITGTPEVGQELTGTYTYGDADGDVEGASTYRWLRDDLEIPGETAQTYTLVGADEGLDIVFEVTPVALTGPSPGDPAQSAALGPILPINSVPTASAVTITGTPQVGQELTGSYNYDDEDGDGEGISTFRWLRDGVGITDATESTYVLVSADEGANIVFEVTPFAISGASPGAAAQSAEVGPVQPGNSVPTATAVAITGTVEVGHELTGNYTYGDVDGDSEGTSTFRWLRDDVEIAGAVAQTYTLVEADEGAQIVFEVTPVAQTGTSQGVAAQSEAVGPIAPANTVPTATAVSITGAAQVGQELTGTYTYGDADGDSEGLSTFRWLRDDIEISGATASTYTLVSADEAAQIVFEVTPVALTGASPGDPAQSQAVGPIVPDSGDPFMLEVRVSASSDDAEETNSGSVGLTSSDLELVFDRSSDQTVGLRFNAVTIPRGATITDARIQFQVDEANSTATSLTIRAEATDDALTFVNSSGNISSRSTTSSSVAWSPAPWTTNGQAGPDQETPNIASIIQEVVNRPGWSNGNSLVVIITGTGERTAESYNGVPGAAPLLRVDYYGGSTGNSVPTASNVGITGSTVVGEQLSGSYTYADADGDSEGISTFRWLRDGSPISGATGQDYTLVAADVGALIRFEVRPVAVTGTSPGTPVQSAPVGPVTPAAGGPFVVQVRVSASSDDAEERPNGGVGLTSSDVELVFDRTGDQVVGLRFNGVTIPRGATISNAHVQFQVDEANSVATSLLIQGEAADDADTFVNSIGNISLRPATTSSVPWSPVPWTTVGQAGADERTPDISGIIQEIVDRSGWSSGNSLVLKITGTGERTAEAYDGVAGAAPLLYVVYVVP